jgi:cobalt-zinc-cadmium efflux system outer membrane protein
MRDGSDVLGEQRRVLDQLWRSGDITAVEYLVQLDQTYSAERAGIELKGSLWRAWIDWLDASGTLNEWMETL